MFNKLKQIRDLRHQAKNLQNKLSEHVVTEESNWGKLKISLDGNMEVKSLSIDPSLLSKENKEELEKDLENLFNSAVKKAQKEMASVMSKEGGLGGIADLLK
jgi:DNA-binding YbaB/EbfC family protein